MEVLLRYSSYIPIYLLYLQYRLLIQKIQLLATRARYTTNNTILYLCYLRKNSYLLSLKLYIDFVEGGVPLNIPFH